MICFDVLHYQVIWPDIVQGTNVGMIYRRHGSSLSLETLRKLNLGDFDRDDAVQARVTSSIDFAFLARRTNFDRHRIGSSASGGFSIRK
jgi:hypothetical protein